MDFYQKTTAFIVSLLLLTADIAQACTVCFTQVEDDPQAIALKWSVMTLFVIVLFVLVMVAKFFFGIMHREKMLMNQELRKNA